MNLFELSGVITLDDSAFLKGVDNAAGSFSLLEATAGTVLSGITAMSSAEGLKFVPSFLDGITALLPNLTAAGTDVTGNLAKGVTDGTPKVTEGASSLITSFLGVVTGMFPAVFLAGGNAAKEMAGGIDGQNEKFRESGSGSVTTFISGVSSRFPSLVTVAGDLVKTVNGGIVGSSDIVTGGAQEVVSKVWNHISEKGWGSLGGTIVGGIAGGIINSVGSIISAIIGICDSVVDTVTGFFGGSGDVGQTSQSYSAISPNNVSYAGSGGISVTQNIQTVPQTPSEFAAAARAGLDVARWG